MLLRIIELIISIGTLLAIICYTHEVSKQVAISKDEIKLAKKSIELQSFPNIRYKTGENIGTCEIKPASGNKITFQNDSKFPVLDFKTIIEVYLGDERVEIKNHITKINNDYIPPNSDTTLEYDSQIIIDEIQKYISENKLPSHCKRYKIIIYYTFKGLEEPVKIGEDEFNI